MIVREKELNKIVKDNFYLNNVLLEMEGVLNCNIYFINAVCKYKYKTGILIIFDMLNSINIDLASQYEMIFDIFEHSILFRRHYTWITTTHHPTYTDNWTGSPP